MPSAQPKIENRVLLFTLFQIIGLSSFSSGQLRSADVRRSCPSPELTPFKSTDYAWVFSQKAPFYVSMGSRHLYRSYSEYLQGHPAADQADLDKMDLRIALRGYIVDNTGYEKQQFLQHCTVRPETILASVPDIALILGNLAHVNCKPTMGSAGVNINAIPTVTTILIWTDNKEALLMGRCVSPGYGDWMLLTTKRNVSSSTKATVLVKLTELGLDTTGYKA